MVNYTALVSQLFAAYGRDATEEFIRAYVTVFKTAKPEFLAKAIVESTTKRFEKLPTAVQLVKLARVIEAEEATTFDKNRMEYLTTLDSFLVQARGAKWTLCQRDELIRLCDEEFNRKRATYRTSRELMIEKVRELAQEVREFRKATEEAFEKNQPMPDETRTSWSWAITGDDEWDPAFENWKAYIERSERKENVCVTENGTLSAQQNSMPLHRAEPRNEEAGVQAEPF